MCIRSRYLYDTKPARARYTFHTYLRGVDAGGGAESGRLGLRHAADGAAERVAHQLRGVTRLLAHVDVRRAVDARGAAHVSSCVNIA